MHLDIFTGTDTKSKVYALEQNQKEIADDITRIENKLGDLRLIMRSLMVKKNQSKANADSGAYFKDHVYLAMRMVDTGILSRSEAVDYIFLIHKDEMKNHE